MKIIPIELAKQLEHAEALAWRDMVIAAPQPFIQKTGLSLNMIDEDTCLRCPGIPFVHFNCVLGFGTSEKLTDQYLDGLIGYYQENRSPLYLFLVKGLHEYIEPMLTSRGFVPAGSWERLFRDNRELPSNTYRIPMKWTIKRVTQKYANDWAGFVSETYGMPETKDWLLAFADRENWFHYMLEEEGKTVAVRSFFKGPDGIAFSGIEAPIPGLMTTNYQMDLALMYHIIKDGLKNGVKRFVADIETVDEKAATPAYINAKALGFMIPYRRLVYKRDS